MKKIPQLRKAIIRNLMPAELASASGAVSRDCPQSKVVQCWVTSPMTPDSSGTQGGG